MDGALGFAAGVMLAASFTSLIIPGIETYSDGNPIPVLLGVALGASLWSVPIYWCPTHTTFSLGDGDKMPRIRVPTFQ
jgi:zinc transporter ZupT